MKLLRMMTPIVFVITLIVWGISVIMGLKDLDNTKPVITAESDVLTLTVRNGEKEDRLMEGLTATDNRDGDLTDEIIVGNRSKFKTPGVFEVTYLVFDRSNNAGSYTRTVEYTDYYSPQFSLAKPLVYNVGDKLTIQDNLTVTDAIDGDLSDDIRIVSSDVDANQEGDYNVEVSITNSYGDTSDIVLPVILTNKYKNTVDMNLTTYIAYINQGSYFNAMDYLESVTLSDGTAGDFENVSVINNVDTSRPGSYSVKYRYNNENSYDNSTQEGCTVLTVVVR